MIEADKLLDKNLEHIGEALQQTKGADTVRTETALEGGAHLTLEIDVEQSEQRVEQQQAYADSYTFNRRGGPAGQKACEPVVNGACHS